MRPNPLPFILTAFLLFFFLALVPSGQAGGAQAPELAWPQHGQHASFPVPSAEYAAPSAPGLAATLKDRAMRDPFNLAASVIFLCAILHTFSVGFFNKWAHAVEVGHRKKLEAQGKRDPAHPEAVPEVSFLATMLHFLGEVEAVFGLWAIVLAATASYFHSWADFTAYMQHDRHFGEPIFVVVIMAIASSRPVLRFAETLVAQAARLGKGSPGAWWLSIMIIPPLLGSLITEPAAITIGALLLAKKFYRHQPGRTFAYASIGLLFVSVSIGGVLTHFAAPPVLMVAGVWGWDTPYMLEHFGYKAVLAIVVSTVLYFALFRKELARMADAADGSLDGVLHPPSWADREDPVPFWVIFAHLLFLAWTVINVHQPVLFVAGFLFFLAFVMATEHHQNTINLRGPMLVGFFLAGLIIHGGCQGWWIEPVIKSLPADALMFGATILTAFNDNAAITYLAAQVEGISEASKLAVVAGAVTGGGLTVIANAPNPAGQSILSKYFPDGISPLGLLLGALVPTIISYIAFALLPTL